MGNYKWNNNDSNRELPYVVVLMISRNKDNASIPFFKGRKRAQFRTFDLEKIKNDFNHFVQDGKKGEYCRLYISLNSRNVEKVQKELLHLLIDKEICFDYLEPTVAGIAAKRENANEKKWFFDFDTQCGLDEFLNDILEIDETTKPEAIRTPHGYAVIVQHGFDTRDLLKKWNNVTLKRDDLICYDWSIK